MVSTRSLSLATWASTSLGEAARKMPLVASERVRRVPWSALVLRFVPGTGASIPSSPRAMERMGTLAFLSLARTLFGLRPVTLSPSEMMTRADPGGGSSVRRFSASRRAESISVPPTRMSPGLILFTLERRMVRSRVTGLSMKVAPAKETRPMRSVGRLLMNSRRRSLAASIRLMPSASTAVMEFEMSSRTTMFLAGRRCSLISVPPMGRRTARRAKMREARRTAARMRRRTGPAFERRLHCSAFWVSSAMARRRCLKAQ